MANEISKHEDIIDLRDVIERFEELEMLTYNNADGEITESERTEFDSLTNLLQELKGMGGDEQWRGDWFPITLIAESYFEDYARELAEDIGAISNDMSWPNTCIDWERAARELQIDYNTVDFGGFKFWYR